MFYQQRVGCLKGFGWMGAILYFACKNDSKNVYII